MSGKNKLKAIAKQKLSPAVYSQFNAEQNGNLIGYIKLLIEMDREAEVGKSMKDRGVV